MCFVGSYSYKIVEKHQHKGVDLVTRSLPSIILRYFLCGLASFTQKHKSNKGSKSSNDKLWKLKVILRQQHFKPITVDK